MQRALDLAQLGLGKVSPNPMVGAVIVHQGRVIGEGWHQRYGGPHAEVVAVQSVADKHLLAESTLYVTLEPCCHHGKTPPCADLILDMDIPHVVVAMTDPNPLVAGKGIAKLRQAGVRVEVGILEAQAKEQNKRFLVYFEQKRPYVILKWAQSSDGFLASSLEASTADKKISNELSQQLVHKWRSEEDAIMVGYRTLLHDNPKLNTRLWKSSKPLTRVTLDEKGSETHPNLHFYDGHAPSFVFNYQKEERNPEVDFLRLSVGDEPIAALLARLKEMGIGSLLVEGGTALLQKFIAANLWDEARVCTAQKTLGTGIVAPVLQMSKSTQFSLGGDVWQIGRNIL
jgi:diaminohydroxyphosphoribosylaminopyrimidine deaminase / 5-amino-6-(5-phosphoribosylamino)uracil reductase